MNMDESLHIRTSTGVSLDFEVASLGDRVMAWFIDILVLGAYVILMNVILFGIIEFRSDTIFYILIYLPVMLYHFMMETFMNGQSVGKRAREIQVVKLDGSQAGVGEYAMRSILRLVDITLTNGALAILFIVGTQRAQRLGDLAAGTTVVKLKKTNSLSNSLLRETDEDYEVRFKEAALLSNEDAETINRLLLELKRTRNSHHLIKLAQKARVELSERLKLDSFLNDLEFLETIANDYSYLQSKD